VMQAIPETKAAADALAYLRRHQHSDGGFSTGSSNGPVNSQSTGWAVQAMIAVGADPARIVSGGNSALDYLAARQKKDGHYRYSESSDQTPVWVTAEVMVGAARKSLPIESPPREKKDSGKDEKKGSAAAADGGTVSPGIELPPGSPGTPSGSGGDGGTAPGTAPPSAVPLSPGVVEGDSPPTGDAEARGAAAAFAEPAADDGPSPWVAVGIGAACTAVAIGASLLLGRRFGW